MTTSLLRSPLLHQQLSGDDIKCLSMLSKSCRCRSSSTPIHLCLNDCRNFQYGCPVLLILPMMQDQKWWTLCWSSFSGWARERVSLLFDYQGGQYMKQRRWHTKVNILQLSVGYLNVTINRQTWKPKPEIGTEGSSQSWQNPWVDRCGHEFGPPRSHLSGFGTGLDPNRTLFPVQTPIAGRLPGPVANTKPGRHVRMYQVTDTNGWCEMIYHGMHVD